MLKPDREFYKLAANWLGGRWHTLHGGNVFLSLIWMEDSRKEIALLVKEILCDT